MRQWCLPVLAFALAACGRETAPHPSATSALPPPPGMAVAQAAPPLSVAPPAQAITEVAAAPAAALSAPRNDPRWRDVDPAELETEAKIDPALANFQEEQKKRDAELLAQDSQAAQQHREDDARGDRYAREEDRYERYAGEDERYDGYAREDERYAREGDRYAGNERYRDDSRYGDSRYGDDPYAARRASRARQRAQEEDREEFPPPDDLDPYAEPQPWEEGGSPEFDPEAGEYYEPYQR